MQYFAIRIMKGGQFLLFLLAVLSEFKLLQGRNDSFILCLYQQDNLCQECTVNITDFSDGIMLPSGNFSIQFCSEQFILNFDLKIEGRFSVSVIGTPTKIICNQSNPLSFQFSGIMNLFLQNLELYGCGSQTVIPFTSFNFQDSNDQVIFITSIYIVNCTNVRIENLTVNSSHGNGLTMINNDGIVEIAKSKFTGSAVADSASFPGGSGLYVALSYCKPRPFQPYYNCSKDYGKTISNSYYTIKKTVFMKNSARGNNFTSGRKFLAEGHGRGGGISIVIDQNSSANVIEVLDCNFTENSAVWGGGLHAVVYEQARDNTINISRSTFERNSCSQGSGGVNVEYRSYGENSPQNNTAILRGCTLRQNRAYFGGGMGFYASLSKSTGGEPDQILLQNCTWVENEAVIGAALNFGSPVWERFHYNLETNIVIDECTFESNFLVYDKNFSVLGGGTVFAVGYRLKFKGQVTFNNNSGSAMYMLAAEVEFQSGSNVTFSNNVGDRGGAIHLRTFSIIILNDNVAVYFVNNSGKSLGGAIFYFNGDIRDYFSSQHCFFVYNGSTNISERNVSLVFSNNTAGLPHSDSNGQNSIFAFTMQPCLVASVSFSPKKVFGDIGEFLLPNTSFQISTLGRRLQLLEKKGVVVNNTLLALPGTQIELPIQTQNDFQEELKTQYEASIKEHSTSISIEPFIYNNLIVVLGRPGDSATIVLETMTIRHVILEFKVTIQECPPGFRYDSMENKCTCFTFSNRRYTGIHACGFSYASHYAAVRQNYWINYDESKLKKDAFGKEQDLLHSICPLAHCTNGSRTKELPNTTSIAELDLVICGKARTSILCSRCRKGYATKYHDNEYACLPLRSRYECRLGWLYYIISEIVPVTLFFGAVTVFKIKMTDGAVSGFLLYVQLTDVMRIEVNGQLQFSKHLKVALDIYRLATRIFNLNFFAIDSLSFCLWENATAIDMAAFRYVTLLYSLLLVLAIVAAFRYCRGSRLLTVISKLGYRNEPTKGVVIHGISGFLVICYSECARVSLLLLAPSYLYKYNYEDSRYHVYKTVAFYDGTLDYFRGKHLLYALPALLVTVFVLIIPPLLLISYPLCYKVLGVLKLSESKFTKLLCTVIPLEKFKPFFDSFQNSFKDEYRFFAGLYFFYRFSVLALFAFSRWINFYAVLQIQLSIFLSAHALCKPYKKTWHNVLNMLLLINLAVLNALTHLNFDVLLASVNDTTSQFVTNLVQVVLLYSVLLYFIAYVAKQIFSSFMKNWVSLKLLKIFLKKGEKSEPDDYCELSHEFSLNAAENRLKR